MFIEVTSLDTPLYLRVGEILMVGSEDKKGTFIVTESMDCITVKESYDKVKTLIDEDEKRMFPSGHKNVEGGIA